MADVPPTATEGAPDPAAEPEAAPPESDQPDLSVDSAPFDGESTDSEVVEPVAPAPDYLDDLRRLQAEFENFRKRTVKQQSDLLERAAENLVRELLPVLDIADLARAHGADDQVGIALFDVLQK